MTKDVLLIIQPPVPDGMTSFKEVMPTLLADENVDYEARGRGNYRFNKYIYELPYNNYMGDQNIFAAYNMVEIPITEPLKIVAGLRYETTDLSVVNSGERAEAIHLSVNPPSCRRLARCMNSRKI